VKWTDKSNVIAQTMVVTLVMTMSPLSLVFHPIRPQPRVFGAPGESLYFVATIAGGFQVPSPAGKIEGGVSLGQYSRIAR
jgi:hypothetical protein